MKGANLDRSTQNSVAGQQLLSHKSRSVKVNITTYPADWDRVIPLDQWQVYKSAINSVRNANIPFLLGGAFAIAAYTGRWRNTKDLDFYIRPKDRDALVNILTDAGFVDYYDELPYDRSWIYRSTKDGMIVDLIWAMANHRANVDERWFKDAPIITIRNESLFVLRPEDLTWCKLYIMQKDRCDWTDVINIIFAVGPQMDWSYLIERLEDDIPILDGFMQVFAWVCPGRAQQLPEDVKNRFRLSHLPPDLPLADERRVRLLDSRPWFSAYQPATEPMNI